jgi:tRNA G18 (ribose-2'-O)-methylase SpoU
MPLVRVTDPDDVLLADYRSLNDQPFRRRLEGDTFFMAEGYVAIDRLLESGHRIRSVLLAPSRLSRFEPHLERLDREGVPVLVADRPVISQTVGFDLHRGVVASAQRRAHPDIATLAASSRRLAVLEGLNDAENLGVIARAARAFGIDGLVIDSTCTDPYSRRTVRVSMGEVLMLPIARADALEWPEVFKRLGALGYETWAMTPSADAHDLWTLDVPDRVAVVLGAEGPGLTSRTLAASRRRVRIPISADVDSLNVGHAAAVTFAALTRTSIRK